MAEEGDFSTLSQAVREIAENAAEAGTPVSDETAQQLYELDVHIAGTDTEAYEQIVEALPHVDVSDETQVADQVEQILGHAEAASEHSAAAEAARLEQAEAIEAGDYEAAQAHAADAEYHLELVDAHGRDSDPEIMDAQQDQASLDWADWHQEIAEEHTIAAADYAESGDLEQAASHAQQADDSADVAADYGSEAAYDTGATTSVDYTTVTDTTDYSSDYSSGTTTTDYSSGTDTTDVTSE